MFIVCAWGNICVFERDREKMCLLCVLGGIYVCLGGIERK